jgi:hypothetical protein
MFEISTTEDTEVAETALAKGEQRSRSQTAVPAKAGIH